MALASFIEAQIAAADEERKAAEAAFSAAARKAGIDFDWRAEKSPDSLVSPHAGAMARAADMILCPQVRSEASIGRHQLEEVVFASGRPVIGLPAGWSVKTLGKRVLIAWDGGREAARACFDALPILVKAEAVRSSRCREFSTSRCASSRLATISPRPCRVMACAWRRWRSRSTRAENARRAARRRRSISAPTFSVMGCYGHSRFRERILGGVSRSMLKDIPFPLLLAN